MWEKRKQELYKKKNEYQKALDTAQSHSVNPVHANPGIERVYTDYVNSVQNELQHATTKLNQLKCERDQLLRNLENHKNTFDPNDPVKLALVLMELHALGQLNQYPPFQDRLFQDRNHDGSNAEPGGPGEGHISSFAVTHYVTDKSHYILRGVGLPSEFILCVTSVIDFNQNLNLR